MLLCSKCISTFSCPYTYIYTSAIFLKVRFMFYEYVIIKSLSMPESQIIYIQYENS